MRTNLVAMLDGIGLNEKLEIDSTRSLFGEHHELLSGTSAVLYPAFVDGKNYTGTPGPEAYPLLQAFVDQVLTAELAMTPDAFIIPLGKTVSTILQREVARGAVQAERCLFDFPHPSGANGHRARLYAENKTNLTARVAEWQLVGSREGTALRPPLLRSHEPAPERREVASLSQALPTTLTPGLSGIRHDR
jgi:hypothetical protein